MASQFLLIQTRSNYRILFLAIILFYFVISAFKEVNVLYEFQADENKTFKISYCYFCHYHTSSLSKLLTFC